MRSAAEARHERLLEGIPDGEVDLSWEPSYTGFRLTEAQRRAMSTRLMLQAPTNLTISQVERIRRDLDAVVDGLPPGAFMALDSLRLLAEQGNEIAKLLFDHESVRLGLTRPLTSFARS